VGLVHLQAQVSCCAVSRSWSKEELTPRPIAPIAAIVRMSSQVYFSHWPKEGRVAIEYGTLRSCAAR
jgi:hypothetical protein